MTGQPFSVLEGIRVDIQSSMVWHHHIGFEQHDFTQTASSATSRHLNDRTHICAFLATSFVLMGCKRHWYGDGCDATYQARQADLTGGAANFFLVTPLGAAAGRTVIACSFMTDACRRMSYEFSSCACVPKKTTISTVC